MYSIGPLTVAPGERAHGLIPVGTSSYGVELGIPLIVVNGVQDGPVLCVDAGVHGDEYDGQEAIRRVLAEIDPATLRGTIVGIPCLNTPAFEAAARASGIDHLNLNRIFPG
ncbi:M14 family metallopeptidase, partial [Streptomyces sp. NPDC029044]